MSTPDNLKHAFEILDDATLELSWDDATEYVWRRSSFTSEEIEALHAHLSGLSEYSSACRMALRVLDIYDSTGAHLVRGAIEMLESPAREATGAVVEYSARFPHPLSSRFCVAFQRSAKANGIGTGWLHPLLLLRLWRRCKLNPHT